MAVPMVVRPTGPPFELVDEREEDSVVDLVEAVAVDIEGLEGMTGYGKVNASGTFHLGEVSDATQQRVGYTRCASASERDLKRRILADADAEKSRGTLHNPLQKLVIVVFQVAFDTETGAERRRQVARAGGGSNKCEGGEGQLHAFGAGTFVKEDIDAVILHRGIEIFPPPRDEVGGFHR